MGMVGMLFGVAALAGLAIAYPGDYRSQLTNGILLPTVAMQLSGLTILYTTRKLGTPLGTASAPSAASQQETGDVAHEPPPAEPARPHTTWVVTLMQLRATTPIT